METNIYSRRSLQIGSIALALKIMLIAAFIYFFWQPSNENASHPNEYLVYLVDVASIIGLVALLLSIVALFKKQWCWQLYTAIPISLIAIFIAPMVFKVQV